MGTGPDPILDENQSPSCAKACPQDGDVCSQVSSKSSSKDFVGNSGRKEKPGKPNPKSFSSDLTVTLDRIDTTGSLNELVVQISDGEFNADKLDGYEYQDELHSACLEAIKLKANRPYTRNSLGNLMADAMGTLDTQNIAAPRGWYPVIKTLRQGGRISLPIRASRQYHDEFKPPTDLWTDPCSSLRCYETELKPFREILDAAATHLPIPSCWTEAVEFLNAVINTQPSPSSELVKVRDTIQEKIPTPVEQSSTSVAFCSAVVQ